jgi:uncharacterized protein (TIGR03435 family)
MVEPSTSASGGRRSRVWRDAAQKARLNMTRLLPCCYLVFTAMALGQATIPKNNHYEVVAIKPGIKGQPPGFHPSPLEFRIENWTLQGLIANLYGVPPDRVIGLPVWTSSETFSFRAKSVIPAKNYGESWGRLIPVLEERFKLKYHREKRQMRIYELSVEPARRIQLPVTNPGSCKPAKPDDYEPGSNGVKAAVEPGPPRNECGRWLNQVLPEGGFKLSVKGVSMAALARSLERFVGRPVADGTGLTALFDIESLIFSNEGITFGSQVLFGNRGLREPAPSDAAVNAPSGLPTIFAALKKAGLRLKSGMGPVEVLVIDKLEKPSEN